MVDGPPCWRPVEPRESLLRQFEPILLKIRSIRTQERQSNRRCEFICLHNFSAERQLRETNAGPVPNLFFDSRRRELQLRPHDGNVNNTLVTNKAESFEPKSKLPAIG